MKNVLKKIARATILPVADRLLGPRMSFSAAGEDRLVLGWLRVVEGLDPPAIRYCDIGANHPRDLNNTYALYCRGARGLLIEPDPDLAGKLRRERPRDIVLNAGVAFDERRRARMKIFSSPVFNTFVPEQADLVVQSSKQWKGGQQQRVVREIEVDLVPANDVLDEHFATGIDFLSIDTEGCDLDIVRSIDFDRHRPRLICVEASDGFGTVLSPLYELLARTPDNLIWRLKADRR